jgi:hypothetical protein
MSGQEQLTIKQLTALLGGAAAVLVALLYVSLQYYDKSQLLSIIILSVGLPLIIAFIAVVIYFYKKVADAPWNFLK